MSAAATGLPDAQTLIAIEGRLGAQNYKPLDVVLSHGAGAWVTDTDGRRDLDCVSAYSAVNQLPT
ncbi:MAG: hypothetical protein ACOYOJ_21150 [Alsobacter sp.]